MSGTFLKKLLQIVICEIVLFAIIVCSAPLLGFDIFSYRSLQILIFGIVLSALIINYLLLMRFKILSARWVQILVGGLLLFALVVEVLRETNNIYFLPAAIVLGALVVPVTCVAYLYRHIQTSGISILLLAACFVIGGSLGIIAVGFAEYDAPKMWTVVGSFGIGLIEESMKLVLPMVMFVSWRYSHEADGLLLGVASGMGFSALETMGDALYFFQTSESLGTMQQVLLYRGLLTPAAHAAWTGFVCAILWRQRERTGRWIGPSVLGAFLIAVVLHALWNIIGYAYMTADTHSLSQMAVFAGEFIPVMGISLFLVFWRFRKSRNVTAGVAQVQ